MAKISIAVVGKTKNDTFYEQSFKGCQSFAKHHSEVECIYDGADDYQDFRTQSLIVNDLVAKRVDGLLISTTESNFLVSRSLKRAKQLNIPVITFDSDLLEEHKSYRLAYVGTDNFAFGVALGEAAKAFKSSEPQQICIQTGHHSTPNLDKRMNGVRYALSEQTSTEPLNGSHGWVEFERCPLFTMGKREDALSQLLALMSYDKPPIFLAVAGFAQFHPNYVERMLPFREKLASRAAVIISADTEEVQLQALKNGLSTMNIGQNPFEMGRKGAELLYQRIKFGKRPEKDSYYLDFHYCNQENSADCTVNH
ncbi:substrate-binding domain-containing protein [Pseudoalteromonas piscicida]|uniref:substrate-binding domain-containing protein n=1 Tax=Pseudoalteromonas piscicida TaxID=43662 RepID=UPI001F5B9E9C|nr:substrate-binding domain-containing protein [Pseudoalteromonas piscicida]